MVLVSAGWCLGGSKKKNISPLHWDDSSPFNPPGWQKEEEPRAKIFFFCSLSLQKILWWSAICLGTNYLLKWNDTAELVAQGCPNGDRGSLPQREKKKGKKKAWRHQEFPQHFSEYDLSESVPARGRGGTKSTLRALLKQSGILGFLKLIWESEPEISWFYRIFWPAKRKR